MNFKTICAATAAIAALPGASVQAASVPFAFSGGGVSGSLVLTTTPDLNTGVLGTSPNTVDPIGSQIVTGISGTFTDTSLGLTDVTITGIVNSKPGAPTSTNLLAPASFGFYPVQNGVPGPDGVAPGFSYDDLYYPSGSPQTATSYPFHGGIFDIYGLVFTVTGGDAVNLWSNGDMGSGVTYGVGVTDGTSVLDYVSPVAAVPEPASWAMVLGGLGIIGGALRRRGRFQPRLAAART